MTNKIKGTDPYTSEWLCVKRLYKEFKCHNTLYVAFDFDNTVFDYHNEGWYYDRVESLLTLCKKAGFKLILFTAKETDEQIAECVAYCKQRGYEPDYINESPIMNTKKPYYNILLDDRAGLSSAVSALEKVINKIYCKKRILK